MKTLAVVTFTDYSNPTLLQRCKDSVAADLPVGATHHIIESQGLALFAKQRIDAFKLADYYTVVDHDDVIVNNGLSKCFAAIQSGDYGCAFTDEALVDLNGTVLSTRVGQRTYEEIQIHTWRLHHLVMINPNAITDDLTGLYGRVQGVQHWAALAAIKNKGAIHVPVIGYQWSQYSTSLSHKVSKMNMPPMKLLQTGPIPQYTV